MREIISFVFTAAGFLMLLGLLGHDDISTMQGIANTVNVADNIAMPLGCLGIGWLVGDKK